MYKPACATDWQGRADNAEGNNALRWHQRIQTWNQHDNLNDAPTLLGFACDEGVRRNQGRIGAKQGPDTIRQVLGNFAYHNEKTPFDAGTIECEKKEMERAQEELSQHITRILSHHGRPIILGGGHEVSWSSFLGLANYLNEQNTASRIGIINFDAHFDLRPPIPQANSGTAFHQIATWYQQQQQAFNYLVIGLSPTSNTQSLYEFANQHDVTWIEDVECCLPKMSTIEKTLTTFLNKVDALYVTICMDVFPAHIAPGVSAPSSLGVEPIVVIQLLRHFKTLCREKNITWLLSDIAELNPSYDIDQCTAKLAARLVHELSISLHN